VLDRDRRFQEELEHNGGEQHRRERIDENLVRIFVEQAEDD
jgi:hypothetical protein